MLNKIIPLSLHNSKLNGGEIATPDKSAVTGFPEQLARIIEDGKCTPAQICNAEKGFF